jgi:hypothetical protein
MTMSENRRGTIGLLRMVLFVLLMGLVLCPINNFAEPLEFAEDRF